MKIIKEIKDYIKLNGIKNKDIIFYSERSVYYKYFEGLINDILSISDKDIIYVTSDYNDAIFKLNNPRIKVFYINSLLKTFLQYLDCRVFVTTMAELGNHHFVRSKAKADIEYVYVFHAVVSTTMMYMEGAFDNYDTVFAVGSHHNREIREREALLGLKEKNIINYGYPLLDKLSQEYEKNKNNLSAEKPFILIAPSWHEGNILDLCIDELLANVDLNKYRAIVRPHPEYLKRYGDKFNALEKRYKNTHIIFDKDMLSNESMFKADLLITDWSGIAYEYAFAALRPVLFVNTPKKVHNKNYEKQKNLPMEVTLRKGCGTSVDIDELKTVSTVIDNFFNEYDNYKEYIAKLREEYIYNYCSDRLLGAKYIINGKI